MDLGMSQYVCSYANYNSYKLSNYFGVVCITQTFSFHTHYTFVERCYFVVMYITISAVFFSCSTNRVHGQTTNGRYVYIHIRVQCMIRGLRVMF